MHIRSTTDVSIIEVRFLTFRITCPLVAVGKYRFYTYLLTAVIFYHFQGKLRHKPMFRSITASFWTVVQAVV